MKKKLQLYGQERGVEVDVDATVGAIIGVNLFDQNGELYVPPDAGVPEDEYPITFWRLIQEIPPNVTALAETTTTGLYVVTGPGTSATREIESESLDVTNGDAVAGNIKIEEAPLRLPAGETIHGRRVVRATGGEAFHPDIGSQDDVLDCVGIALNAATITDTVEIRQRGLLTDAGWAWSPGAVYCDDGGILTQTPPSSGWYLIVGRAVATDTIDINLQLPIFRSP